MGYYDDQDGQRRGKENRRSGGKFGYFLSGLIGVIVGALVVALLFQIFLEKRTQTLLR